MKLWAAIDDLAPLTMAEESRTRITESHSNNRVYSFDDILSHDGPSHLK